MKTEFLLVGQGLCGTWLSYFLEQEKRDFLVLDPGDLPNASRQAGGLINPVTGRRLVTTWLIDELLPFARLWYGQLAQLLFKAGHLEQPHLIEERSIIQFFSSPDVKHMFEKRVWEQSDYLQTADKASAGATDVATAFDPLQGYGLIKKSCQVQVDLLLGAYKKYLLHEGRLLEKKFDTARLQRTSEGLRFDDIAFDHLIFCDGIGAHDNALFAHLPFASVKGEALIVEVPGLPAAMVVKGPLTMIPLATKDHWWVGSSYEWNFSDSRPSTIFRKYTEHQLNQWLKMPFTTRDHWSAIRPGSKERRPFVGMLEPQRNIGLLGGMGTKGCSLAPYFSYQLVQHLLHHQPIYPEARLTRFIKN